ncbi:MAG TPA: hypothetical protein VM075_01805 [Anaerolineae bacterium]|nr:hypothetical protein [Anaerolineae bacterium]
MECLDTLGTLLAGAVLLAFVLASLFRFGSRIGEWFSSLETENRKLYWAAIGLVFWTVIVAVAAWGVSLLLYLAYAGVPLDNPAGWTTAASVGLLLASPVVALLAGIPWLVLVGLVRVIRWRSRRSGGREHSE